MRAVNSADVEIIGPAGSVIGVASISLLPYRKYPLTVPPILESSDGDDDAAGLPRIQLLEDQEYRFELQVGGANPVSTDRPEVFQADTTSGVTGRVRPQSYTGTLPVGVFSAGTQLGKFLVEVRSRKLNYLSEYRWMLRDIAECFSDLLIEQFAVSQQTFTPHPTSDAATLYQRIAFLSSLIVSPQFEAALAQVLQRPHVAWEPITERGPFSKGFRIDSKLINALRAPGPRAPWSDGPTPTAPLQIDRVRTEASLDTTPNQFVKFAVATWRAATATLEDALLQLHDGATRERGLFEVGNLLRWLDGVLAHELFREIGTLDRFPTDNQTLLRRAGYREIFRTYLQFEAAAQLTWSGGDDVFAAGKRDVATLYEYWVFVQLASIVSALLSEQLRFSELVERSKDGLELHLKAGRQTVLAGETEESGRRLAITLYFNRSFRPGTAAEGSWTAGLRPDYTLRIAPAAYEQSIFEPVFVHFDAKYRLSFLNEVLGSNPENTAVDIDASDLRAEATSSDLLKMHAYRDAIRRSAGAYILYPGTETLQLREYHEILPGLGAFVLRPTEGGSADGSSEVRHFISDVIKHVALQVTQHERARYWINDSYALPKQYIQDSRAARFLKRPPRDTRVLIGFVKSREHWEWILSNHLYNLRADDTRRGALHLDSSEMSFELAVLSCPSINRSTVVQVVGPARVLGRADLDRLRYPQAGGEAYLCFSIEAIDDAFWEQAFAPIAVERIRRSKSSVSGMPVVVSWIELVAVTSAGTVSADG